MRKADVFVISTHCPAAVCQGSGAGRRGGGLGPARVLRVHLSQVPSQVERERERQGRAWEVGVQLNFDLKSSARVGREGRETLQLVRRAGLAKFRAICTLPF